MKSLSSAFVIVIFLMSCNKSTVSTFSETELLTLVKALDKQFSVGVKNADSTYLVNIYSDSALYMQPHTEIITGKEAIGREWAGFLRLKEKPVDLILKPDDVRGTREIIYEIGKGYTLLADSTKWNFNYLNVWRLQNDGSYKLEVDTYN